MRFLILLLFGEALFFSVVYPQSGLTPGTSRLNFYYDNDGIFNYDRYYTFGLKIALVVSSADSVFSFPGDAGAQYYRVYSIGQKTFTPSDTYEDIPSPADRPFAGWLWGGFSSWMVFGSGAHVFEIQAGIVGPSAGGEKIMSWFHRVMGYHNPRGWAYQLPDQFGINLAYSRKWKFRSELKREDVCYEAIPAAAIVIGNVYSYLSGEFFFRFGRNLPLDFGHALLLPGAEKGVSYRPARATERKWHAYLYLSGNVRYVIRNIFLDGGMLNHGRSVEKTPLVADFGIGASVRFGHFEISAGAQLRTREFAGQPQSHPYGSLILSWIF